eukprot:s1514_g7.t1
MRYLRAPGHRLEPPRQDPAKGEGSPGALRALSRDPYSLSALGWLGRRLCGRR